MYTSGIRGKSCKNITFTLYEGEVLGIYGNTDAVPEEMVNLLSGQDQIVSGEMIISGEKIITPVKKNFVHEGIWCISDRCKGFFYEETVWDNITFFVMKKAARHHLRNRRMEKLAARELAEEWGFSEDRLTSFVYMLSDGEKQKLAFINGIALGAHIFILDNIMPQVDYRSQLMIYKKISEMKKAGASFVFISYDFEDVRMISDRILYTIDCELSERWFY